MSAHFREIVAIIVNVSAALELCHPLEMPLHFIPVAQSTVAQEEVQSCGREDG